MQILLKYNQLFFFLEINKHICIFLNYVYFKKGKSTINCIKPKMYMDTSEK